jgi:isoleucyl-tRNA synthetase
LFHALVRYAAPVLVFTSEEVWQTRFGADADSVHFSDWPEVDAGWKNFALATRWKDIRTARALVSETIEPLRREKEIGSSLQANVILTVSDETAFGALNEIDFAEVCIVSSATVARDDLDDGSVIVGKTANHKCGRCWRHLPEVTEDGALCGRCEDVVSG